MVEYFFGLKQKFGMDEINMMAMSKFRPLDSCEMGMAMAAEEPKDVFLDEVVKGAVKQVSKRQAAARSKKSII